MTRLIDADRFKENILSGLYVFCQENKEDIANAIDDEPTVDISKEVWNRSNELLNKRLSYLGKPCNQITWKQGYDAGYANGYKTGYVDGIKGVTYEDHD